MTCGSPQTTDGGTVGCAERTDVDTYSEGLSRQSPSGITFTLVSASPAPPARGMNTWAVRLDGSTGSPPIATPYMPEHGHGPTALPKVSVTDAGFQVDGINFFMPGLWQVTLAPSADAGMQDSAVFRFCIDG